MNVPYMIAAPLLLQGLDEWREGVDGCGVTGLQAVALYSLPELDGAIDTIVLGGLRGDNVVLIPEVRSVICVCLLFNSLYISSFLHFNYSNPSIIFGKILFPSPQ